MWNLFAAFIAGVLAGFLGDQLRMRVHNDYDRQVSS